MCARHRAQIDRSDNPLAHTSKKPRIQERPRSSRADPMCLAPAPAAAAMEMEELQEADVLWPDHHQDHCHCHGHHQQQLEAAGNKQPQGILAGTTGPPSWAWRYDGDEHAAAAFVPPHVLLAARRRCPEGRATSSVCVGQGRTLKGRDLQSVLRMTGFLET